MRLLESAKICRDTTICECNDMLIYHNCLKLYMSIKTKGEVLRAVHAQKELVIHDDSTQFCNIVGYLPRLRQ